MPHKDVQLKIMVDRATKASWDRAAKQSGLSLSEWLRVRANGTAIVAADPVRKAG